MDAFEKSINALRSYLLENNEVVKKDLQKLRSQLNSKMPDLIHTFPLDFQNYENKKINDLKVGDHILIEIPTICLVRSRVHFINLELGFVFVDGDEYDEDENNFPIYPRNGFYRFLPNEDNSEI